jgi:8-oxo-dGTP pyrophosphatase MutT (NUDIX family)
MAETAPLRPAATVVVLRPATSHPFDVLLVRRNDSVAFMAGAHVFPGGRVDEADAAVPADACEGLETLGRCADLVADHEARYRVAAIRELLEEAGVLLARRRGIGADHDTATALRQALAPKASLVELLATHGLAIALDAVMPFAHWVTPEIETRRFDTRFLLARLPEGQLASHDATETTSLAWLSPQDAITQARRGAINLPPPTWSTLQRFGKFRSIDEAWHWASSTPIVRIQPGFFRVGDATTLTLPGDPTYPRPEGCEPFDETRFRLVEGKGWQPLDARDDTVESPPS